ncbi:MAG: hypothetical protein N2383_03390 [Caldilineales bacterium]|nr:hypothetical protein [Caldilineales bacterium]
MIRISTNFAHVDVRLQAVERASPTVLLHGVTQMIDVAATAMHRTTRTWRTPPLWQRQASTTPTGARASLSSNDRRLLWLEYGTRPHPIRPRMARALRFLWDGPGSYGAKTSPGLLDSRPAIYPRTPVYRFGVSHPGFRPRAWLPVLLELLAQQAYAIFRNVVRLWLP